MKKDSSSGRGVEGCALVADVKHVILKLLIRDVAIVIRIDLLHDLFPKLSALLSDGSIIKSCA